MNSSFYVALVLLVAVAIADDSRSKKEAIYNLYGQITDANEYLAAPGHDDHDGRQLPYGIHRPAAYPSDGRQHYQQRQYPYAVTGYGRQQYCGQHGYPHSGFQQYPYDGDQQYSYDGHRQQYPFGYDNAYGFDHVLRQAPAYPSSGAQALNPPVPHPFYHVQGTYYPTTIEMNKPPAAVVKPKQTYK